MSADFISRIIGMIFFMLVGARVGLDSANALGLPDQATSVIFALVGMLNGLIITPWLTIRPIRFVSKLISEMSMEIIFASLIGLAVGLGLALLAAYPLSLLGGAVGDYLPPLVSVLAGYFGLTIFGLRAREIWQFTGRQTVSNGQRFRVATDRQLLLDTSVLIDGRIVEVARTGFIGGTLVVPRFVLSELHLLADSTDTLRRNRARRGLTKLNELQKEAAVPVKIIDDDIEEEKGVDNKLIALAIQIDAAVMTNDNPFNNVAKAQGVTVLNINELSNAVRAVYIPGETFSIRIIQEGRESRQGIGYLDDGTMVVVEDGKAYMDRTINVTVTKLISKDTGRMIFAMPEKR